VAVVDVLQPDDPGILDVMQTGHGHEHGHEAGQD
jgi:hypothetical protein